MAVIVKAKCFADLTDEHGSVHQQVLRLADSAIHQIFHRRQTGLRLENVRQVELIDVKALLQIRKLNRLHKMFIQILQDTLQELLCGAFTGSMGLLTAAQLLKYQSEHRISQLIADSLMICCAVVQLVQRKQDMLD